MLPLPVICVAILRRMRIVRLRRRARILDGPDVLSEILDHPGPTDTMFDVLAACVAAFAPGPRVAILGFAGGGIVAPLRAMGFAAPTVAQGRVYVVDNAANLHALDQKTGRLLWTHNLGTIGRAAPTFADGRLYLTEQNGKVLVVEPGSTGARTLHDCGYRFTLRVNWAPGFNAETVRAALEPLFKGKRKLR